MKGRNLRIRTSPKTLSQSRTTVFESSSAITPRDKLRGKVDLLMQELNDQVETLETALQNEHNLKDKHEAALRQ